MKTVAPFSRREFIRVSGLGAMGLMTMSATEKNKPSIYLQEYPWRTFMERDGIFWHDDPIKSIQGLMSSPFKNIEPIIDSFEYFKVIRSSIEWSSLDIGSVYFNSVLHEKKNINQRTGQVIEIASFYENIGAKIIVINPSPTSWDKPKDKTDDELDTQAKALDLLGKVLADLGILLAYHNHDVEMRKDARELHWMMKNTNPEYVKYCLDCHWVYRGGGNSSSELFNIINLYGGRVIEIHLRQSSGGIWTEFFADGDIDYRKVAKVLKSKNIKPRLVLEQAVEERSPNTMGPIESYQLGVQYAQKIFAEF